MSLNPKQFTQLQMFMKPSEMKDIRFNDLPYAPEISHDENVEALRQEKLHAADHHRHLTEEITANGVESPVRVEHQRERGRAPRLTDGHHRYFVQERREQDGEEVYLPVIHEMRQEDW